MTLYYQVDNGQIVKGPMARSNVHHRTIIIGVNATDAELAALGFYAEVRVNENPTYDPTTQKVVRSAPVVDTNAGTVTLTWSVVAMTAQEQTDYARAQDLDFILNGLHAIAQIQTTLIDTLLAKNVIAATDFDQATRDLYQAIKTRVDELR